MRLWTLHPRYLDPQGLVALWREGLLARAVIRGETRGYRHHPQLERFQANASPRSAINAYLRIVLREADNRGYAFDRTKIGVVRQEVVLHATDGQVAYEWKHLMAKLKMRSPHVHSCWEHEMEPEAHPLFSITPGAIEAWERVPVAEYPTRN